MQKILNEKTILTISILIIVLLVIATVTNKLGTSGEEALLPPKDGDEQKYAALVQKMAVPSNTLIIEENCAMDPLVIKIKNNTTLTITNNDTIPHTIAFEDQNFFSVSGGQSRTINIFETFKKSTGIYRYACNDITIGKNVGVMYITD